MKQLIIISAILLIECTILGMDFQKNLDGITWQEKKSGALISDEKDEIYISLQRSTKNGPKLISTQVKNQPVVIRLEAGEQLVTQDHLRELKEGSNMRIWRTHTHGRSTNKNRLYCESCDKETAAQLFSLFAAFDHFRRKISQ